MKDIHNCEHCKATTTKPKSEKRKYYAKRGPQVSFSDTGDGFLTSENKSNLTWLQDSLVKLRYRQKFQILNQNNDLSAPLTNWLNELIEDWSLTGFSLQNFLLEFEIPDFDCNAATLAKEKRWTDAIAELQLMSNVKFNQTKLNLLLGACYFNIQKFPEAASHFIAAAENTGLDLAPTALACTAISLLYSRQILPCSKVFQHKLLSRDQKNFLPNCWAIEAHALSIFRALCFALMGQLTKAMDELSYLKYCHSVAMLIGLILMQSPKECKRGAVKILKSMEPTWLVWRNLAHWTVTDDIVEAREYSAKVLAANPCSKKLGMDFVEFSLESSSQFELAIEYLTTIPNPDVLVKATLAVLNRHLSIKNATSFSPVTVTIDNPCTFCLENHESELYKSVEPYSEIQTELLVMCLQNHNITYETIDENETYMSGELMAISMRYFPSNDLFSDSFDEVISENEVSIFGLLKNSDQTFTRKPIVVQKRKLENICGKNQTKNRERFGGLGTRRAGFLEEMDKIQ